MPFGLKNARAIYKEPYSFPWYMHNEIEVYVDDMIAKSRDGESHVANLRKLFEKLRKYQLKFNLSKCTFGVTSEKLLGFIMSSHGIEVDPSKIKAIQDILVPCTQKEVRGLMWWLNYISRFISHLTDKCDPIFKILKKHDFGEWDDDCQKAFDWVKEYLSNSPILVPLVLGRLLILYLEIHERSMACVLGQHDETRKKERTIYYLNKKFTDYETRYLSMEKICCALAWTVKRLWQYMLCHSTWLIIKIDPIKYIFEKPSLSGKVARWQVQLSEYDK